MTRRSITISMIVAVTCLVVPGCATLPDSRDRDGQNRFVEWVRDSYAGLGVIALAIIVFSLDDNDDVYIGTGSTAVPGTPPTTPNPRPTYCVDPTYKQFPECK